MREYRPREPWWCCDSEDAAKALVECGKALILDNPRRKMLLEFYAWWRGLMGDGETCENPSYNAIRSIVETQLSRMTVNLPRVVFHAVGAGIVVQQKAKLLSRYMQGLFDTLELDARREESWNDACVYGAGAVKIVRDGDDFTVKTPWIGDIGLLPADELRRDVTMVIERSVYDRDELCALFPGKEEMIERLPSVRQMSGDDDRHTLFVGANADNFEENLVVVYEGWRRPVGKKKGRYIMAAPDISEKGCLLADQPCKRIPFAFVTYGRDNCRVFGRGIPERLRAQQKEQDQLSSTVAEGARTVTGTKFFLYGGADIDGDVVDNEIGQFVRITGASPPHVVQLGPAAAELISYKERQRQSMYENEGISSLGSQMLKPPGLNSGRAQIVHHDIELSRHSDKSKAVSRQTLAIARLLRDELEDAGDGPVVAAPPLGVREGSFAELMFSEVKLSEHEAVCRIAPVSELAESPEAYAEYLNEFVQSGAMTPQEFKERVRFPGETERELDLELAGRRLAQMLVSKAMAGEDVEATRVADVAYLVKCGWQQHALAIYEQGATYDELEPLRNLIGQAETILQQEAQEEAAKAQAMQLAAMPPQAAPTAAAMPMPDAQATPDQAGGFIQ